LLILIFVFILERPDTTDIVGVGGRVDILVEILFCLFSITVRVVLLLFGVLLSRLVFSDLLFTVGGRTAGTRPVELATFVIVLTSSFITG